MEGITLDDNVKHEALSQSHCFPFHFDLSTMPMPPRAPVLLSANEYQKEPKLYWDRSHYNSPQEQLLALSASSTVYVGNLSFSVTKSIIYNHFSYIGHVEKVIQGLDRYTRLPCGFCFVQYKYRKHALCAVSQLSGTQLDGQIIRVELDAGYKDGRQFGRGKSGGQVRVERNKSVQPNYYGEDQSETTSGQKHSRDNSNYNRVKLDDALPSSRNQASSKTSTDDDNTGNETKVDIKEEQDGDVNNDMDEDDYEQPSKKQRM